MGKAIKAGFGLLFSLSAAFVVYAFEIEGQQTLEIEKQLLERLERLAASEPNSERAELALGTISSIRSYIFSIAEFGNKDAVFAKTMANHVESLLRAGEEGEDVLAAKRGFIWRGYASPYTDRPQLYSIYIPDEYDPEKPWPLVVSLHGGSSNHNVWLALNLGNSVSTKDYYKNYRTSFQPITKPREAIVVAPEGLGQIRWRWFGEEDIFDVIDDVRKNYNINTDKIFLTGLSNGGIGAYMAGLKYAWRFAAILPLSGITDWPRHNVAEVNLRPSEKVVLDNESAITYAENAFNTHLSFFHGVRDSGFKVEQARLLAARLRSLGVPFKYHEFGDLGHDLRHVLWRKLRIMRYVERFSRRLNPDEVRLVTATERAGRQFWVVLDERINHIDPARIRARVMNRKDIQVTTQNVERLTILLDQCPVYSPIQLTVDGHVVYSGPLLPEGRITVERVPVGRVRQESTAPEMSVRSASDELRPDRDGHRANWAWRVWDGKYAALGKRKSAFLSGPLGDANYEQQVHVYGTQVKKDTPWLKKAAEVGARGWVMARQFTEVRHRVIPDSELTYELCRSHVVVLYGNAGNNSVLANIGDKLPIQVGRRHLVLRGRKLEGPGLGARFICPNPLAPSQYLVVQAGTTAQAVEHGSMLPIYLADYIVYNARTTRRQAFMILGHRREVETGFFTEDWKLVDPREQPTSAAQR